MINERSLETIRTRLVRAFARRRGACKADAEDAFQDAMIISMKHTFDDEKAMASFLAVTMKHLLQAEFRRGKRHKRIMDALPQEKVTHPESTFIERDLEAAMSAMGTLEKDRAAMRRIILHGESLRGATGKDDAQRNRCAKMIKSVRAWLSRA